MSLVRSWVQGGQRRTLDVRRHRGGTRPERRRRLLSALQVLEPRHLLAFSTDLFADINMFGVSAQPDSLIEFNSEVFFVANDGRAGSELWKSDGTAEGTILVADINPGTAGSLPANLTVFGSDLFFTALDADDEFDIWKTDGTTSGTVRVFDADAAGVYEISQLTVSGPRLFFTAQDVANGYELWATDGTSVGTALVLDINPDQTISEGPQELTDVNGKLFFTSYSNGYDNRELWESDGMAAGTVLVSNVDGDPLESSLPHNLTNVGGTLYFAADHPLTGVELYKSTGSTGSTVRVTDLNPGIGSAYPGSLTPFDGQLFFTANNGVTGRQLFKTDGMTTDLVANTTPGATGSSSPDELTVVGSELFFVSNGGSVPDLVTAVQPTLIGANSFRSNSTNFAGIVSSTTSASQGIVAAVTANGTFTMTTQVDAASDGPGWVGPTARIGDVGVGLSGVLIGDFIIQDLDLGSDVANATWEWSIQDPAGLTNIDFSGFISGNEFNTFDEAVLFELFLNGSATRTSFLEASGDDLDNWFADRDADNLSLSNPGGVGITSAVVRMTFRPDGGAEKSPNDSNEAVVIRAALSATGASSGIANRELHKTDGTTTVLVKDIVSPGSSSPNQLTEVDGKLFFSADDPLSFGRELWVSDGMVGGTVMVKDIRSGSDSYGVPLSGDPQNLTDINGTLYFSAVDSDNDREVWTSNGMTAGTNLLKNINPGTQDADVQQVVQVGTKLFFVANDGINGEAVWVADLITESVTMAADVTASPHDRVNGLAKFGNGVIFHNDSLGIYTTDGSTSSPMLNATPVAFNDRGDLFVEAGANAFFVRSDVTDGEELWRTNGTAGGTILVADLFDGNGGSQPRDLVSFQDQVFFSASFRSPAGALSGRELFRSNGTSGGTVVISDINTDPDPSQPGAPITLSSDPRGLTVSGASLYFSADGGAAKGNNGRELWVADGNVNGVSMVADIRAGSNSSSPVNLTDVNGVLYFSANDGASGFEPFRSEGTGMTTMLVANVNSGGNSSNPNGFFPVGSLVYFSALDFNSGVELYVTDGTPTGTSQVADLQAGTFSSFPVPLAALSGDRLLVAATGIGSQDRELWLTGGTVTGLVPALDMNPGELFGSDPTDMIPFGTGFLFVGNDGVGGRELYELNEFAAEVESVVIADGSPQRSTIGEVRVTFNTQVDITGDPFDFLNMTTGQAVVDDPVVTVEGGKTVVTFTFLEGLSVNDAGLLENGSYKLTIDALNVSSLGLLMDGNGDGAVGDEFVFGESAVDKFFRKFGDGTGNSVVDLLDFALFRRAFGSSEASVNWDFAFDHDGDGMVALLDFAEFRRNFGT